MTEPTQTGSGEPYIGKQLGSRPFTVTDEAWDNYFLGLELDTDWHGGGSPYGGRVVPAMLMNSADTSFPGAGFENDFGNLWRRQEWEFLLPFAPNETYVVTARVSDIYQRRDRTVVEQETTIANPEGETLARARHHQSYLLDQSSGEVKLRDPKAKAGARRFSVPNGEPLEPIDRTITLEMCGTFFYGNANYHNDKKAAQALGFAEIVVGGRMTISYLGDMMERRFGKGWFEGGRLDVKFTNIVWPADRIIARGVITDRTEEEGGTRAAVSLWMEKSDGTVVLVGDASALE